MQQELLEMLEEIIQYVEVWHAHDQGVIDKAEALIKKAKNNAPAVPQGWKLVPVEPTPEMGMAYLEAAKIHAAEGAEDKMRFSPGGYAAMLANTPAPSPAHVQEVALTPEEMFRAIRPLCATDELAQAQLAKAVAEEREACALECESRQANGNRTHTHPDECASAIRARSNP